MPSQKQTFMGSQNEMLAARLDSPDAEPIAYALFAHCFSCSKDMLAANQISRDLTSAGIAVLRFDFTGLGASEGEFANTNFSSNVGDLVRAAEYLADNFQAPKLLIGHSLGGTAVLSAAKELPSVLAVVTIGAPSDPRHVTHLFADKVEAIEETGAQKVSLAGREFTIQRQFIEDLREQHVLDDVAHFKKALLIFHSPQDTFVSVDHARKIYEAAKHPKSYISLDQADHLLTNKADADYVAAVIAAWASRYLV